jgi:hypothetical protein
MAQPVPPLWVCVHPISKETAEQLLASGVVSHREELIQCIALHMHCGSWQDVRMLRAHHEWGWPLQGARARRKTVNHVKPGLQPRRRAQIQI